MAEVTAPKWKCHKDLCARCNLTFKSVICHFCKWWSSPVGCTETHTHTRRHTFIPHTHTIQICIIVVTPQNVLILCNSQLFNFHLDSLLRADEAVFHHRNSGDSQECLQERPSLLFQPFRFLLVPLHCERDKRQSKCKKSKPSCSLWWYLDFLVSLPYSLTHDYYYGPDQSALSQAVFKGSNLDEDTYFSPKNDGSCVQDTQKNTCEFLQCKTNLHGSSPSWSLISHSVFLSPVAMKYLLGCVLNLLIFAVIVCWFSPQPLPLLILLTWPAPPSDSLVSYLLISHPVHMDRFLFLFPTTPGDCRQYVCVKINPVFKHIRKKKLRRCPIHE